MHSSDVIFDLTEWNPKYIRNHLNWLNIWNTSHANNKIVYVKFCIQILREQKEPQVRIRVNGKLWLRFETHLTFRLYLLRFSHFVEMLLRRNGITVISVSQICWGVVIAENIIKWYTLTRKWYFHAYALSSNDIRCNLTRQFSFKYGYLCCIQWSAHSLKSIGFKLLFSMRQLLCTVLCISF